MHNLASTPRARFFSLVLCFSLLTHPALLAPATAYVAPSAPKMTLAPRPPSKPVRAPKRQVEERGDELLVRFREGVSDAEANALAMSYALKRAGKLRGASGVERLALPPGRSVETVLEGLTSNPLIEFAERNFVITADQTRPNDPRFEEQWALGEMRGRRKGAGVNAPAAWAQTTGSASTVIAVIDSGVDFTHPDLRDNLWLNKEKAAGAQAKAGDSYAGDLHGWDWVANSPNTVDESGHGTQVAGLIAAVGDNNEGITGVMWRASLMSLRVLDKDNKGTVADAVEAIDYAVAHGAHVINCSWGLNEPSVALKEAIVRAGMRDVTVVTSAGNGAQSLAETPHYPASYGMPYVLSVAATGKTEELSAASNWISAVAAPGEELLTTKSGGGYELFSGTSASAAVVSGIAGLVKTLRPRLKTELTQGLILRGTRKVPALEEKIMSGGVVDLTGALAALTTLRPDEGLDENDAEGDKNPGRAVGRSAEPVIDSMPSAASRITDAPAANLPDLNVERRRPHGEARTLPAVPSKRRRCPPQSPRCNEPGSDAARPAPTPAQGKGRAALEGGSTWTLASVAHRSLFTVMSAAMNGGSPVIELPLLDYFSNEGGYSISDSEAPSGTLPRLYAPAPEPMPFYQQGTGNVAAAANGATVTASSSYDPYGLYAANAINGSRTYAGSYWNDLTAGSYPDWLQVNFNGTKSINEVDVFFLQDNYATAAPTDTMTFTQMGITAFDVQYWTGSTWQTVPNGSVTGNNKVWRKFIFSTVSTDRIRVVVNGATDAWSRIVEVEAYEAGASPGTGLTGTYYNGDAFQSYALTRADAAVDFNWGDGAPVAGVSADFFTVRWTGTVVPRFTESYTFYTTSDDGMRVWIDGQLVIDKWIDQGPTEWPSSPVALEAGRAYAIKVEFLEHWGGALAQLRWSSTSQLKEIVPQTRLYGCWKGADQFVRDFFQGALGRQPATWELQDWAARINQAQGGAQLLAEAQGLGAQLFTSAEYAARGRTDPQYVADLYWSYLQRAPDAGGLNFWTNEFNNCGGNQACRDTKRVDLRRAFDVSGEFVAKVAILCGTAAASPVNGGAGYNFSTARLDPSNRTGNQGTDALSRNFNWSVPLLNLPGRAGLDLGLGLSYNSLVWTKDSTGISFDADRGWPSPGFRLGFPVIQPKFYNPQTGKNTFLLVTPAGGHTEFRQVGATNVYESADSSYLQLTDSGSTLALLTTNGTLLAFTLSGGEYHCSQLKDRNGNYITVAYFSDGRIDRITDTLGRVINFNYDSFLNLSSITQPWKRETTTGFVDEVHEWATFGYTNLTLQPSFSNLAVVGEQPGTVIPVVSQLNLDDGSYYKFAYNQWGQVWKVTHYAADSNPVNDNHPLSYVRLNLPGSDLAGASAQSDCPRFTEMRTWVENGVMNQNAEMTTGYSQWAPNLASCNITPPDPTPTVSTDNVLYTEVYATSGWGRGLTTQTEVRLGGTLKKWTTLVWEQDDPNVGYPLNPRVKDSTINDSDGNHRRRSVTYTQFGLPQDIVEYDNNTTTPLRTTRTEYNLSTDYTSRRIIGLPSFRYLYEGTVSPANLRAKNGYVYDDATLTGYLQGLPGATPSATQHDGANYGTGLRWRGNLSRVRRYELNTQTWAETGAFTESTTGYNVTGTQSFTANALSKQTTFTYTDSFDQSVNRSNPALPTFAYPTSVTVNDPGAITASMRYNYDTGWVTQSTDPKNAQLRTLYDNAGRTQRVTRRDGVNSVDKGYTRWVYPTSMGLVQTYTLTDSAQPEAYAADVLDGVGRVRATASDHPGVAGSYDGQIINYDVLGRVVDTSNPTETSATGATWAATGADAPANGGAGWVYTHQVLDWQGRPALVTNDADTTARSVDYNGCGCAGGQVVTQTNELGRKQRTTLDIFGRTVKVEDLNLDNSVNRSSTTTYNVRDQATLVVEQSGTSGPSQSTTTEYDGYGRVWKTKLPQATASTVMTYNADDTLNVKTDARGATATYSYNNRGMVTGIAYAPTGNVSNVTFGYDAAGNRISMTDGLGNSSYVYDALSRMTSETRYFSGINRSFLTTYDYNFADQLTRVTDHFNTTVNYTRDRTGRITDIPGYASGIKYRAWGAIKEQALANGRSITIDYNGRMRVTQFSVPGVTGWQYQYTAEGRLQFASNTQTFGTRDERLDRKLEYDDFGRLWRGLSGSQARGESTFPATGPYRQTYGHDTFDHLTFRDNTRGSAYNSYSAVYTNNRNQNTGWLYDNNGALTQTSESGSTATYSYNAAMEMYNTVMSSTSRTVGYGFDADSQRVVKTETGQPTIYYVRSTPLGGQVLDEVNTSGGKVRGYVYQDGRVIAKQEGAQTQWDVRDPANFSNFLLSSTGTMVSHVELDPLGSAVDPNAPSYTSNPVGFYGSGSLQGTYCSVSGIPIGVPCSLAEMLNRSNFGMTVNVNGDQMPMSMAQGLIDIGRLSSSDVIFGNPWDLRNMSMEVGFGMDAKPVSFGGASTDYGYMWVAGWGSSSGGEGRSSPGAFIKLPSPDNGRSDGFVKCANDSGLGWLLNNPNFNDESASFINRLSDAEGVDAGLLGFTMQHEGASLNAAIMKNGSEDSSDWDVGPFQLNVTQTYKDLWKGDYSADGLDLRLALGAPTGQYLDPFENGRFAARKLKFLLRGAKGDFGLAAGRYYSWTKSKMAVRKKEWENEGKAFQAFYKCFTAR